MRIKFTARGLLVAILLIHTMLLVWGAAIHSPTIDEVEWLPGGWASWKTGRLDIVTRNPPHIGLWAALPLLLVEHDSTAAEVQGGARSIGREFIRTNGRRSFRLFTLGRWACIPFSLVGALACFAWARELYGNRSAILAATLWCFCPNILAHGQLVSHDVPAASLGVLASYAFWRWLRRANLVTTLIAAIALGLALLTKMTVLLYLILWPLLWATWRISSPATRRFARAWLFEGAMLVAILVVALDVLNLGYGFDGSFARLRSYSFDSSMMRSLSGASDEHILSSAIGELPVPLPTAFVKGVDAQRHALEGGISVAATYLRGEWYTRGIPYYYVYALAIKVPVGTWCLVALAFVCRIWRMDAAKRARDEFVLLAPAATILAVVSASPGFTDHLRYVLPCLPFAFIWTSRIAQVSWSQSRPFVTTGAAALGWSILSSLWVYPDSLSYFNEIVGGPRNGHYHLLSSNIDYGQDLLKLKRWYDRHPEARPLGVAYWDYESVDPHVAGIDYFVAPSGRAPGVSIEPGTAGRLGPKPGWYAVNVNFLHGDQWPGRSAYRSLGFYGYFLEFTPVARAGHSIYIYHLTADEVNRVRVQLGLPTLDAEDAAR